jgi:cell division protein FtsX
VSPYIVTRKRPGSYFAGREPQALSRRAVATLEEASRLSEAVVQRVAVERGENYLEAGYGKFGNDCFNLRTSEAGGTVGPLPDGTVIEVEQGPDEEQMLRDLREWVGMHYAPMGHDDVARLWCDAYNARQA